MNNEINKLLPPIEIIDTKSEIDIYGFSNYLANKLNINQIPITIASFRHGWMHTLEYEYLEEITMGIPMSRYLVGSQKEVDFFHKNEIFSVYPVGVPYIYIDSEDINHVKRIENSLLVMPPHSLPGTNPKFYEEEYIKEILSIYKEFDYIVFCIHQSCITKKLWIDTLAKYNIPWIEGANSFDKNSLLRMAIIFSSFEYMTTNTFGSHVAYAAYSGCKVSIFGSFENVKKEDIEDFDLFKKHPKLINRIVEIFSFEYIKKHYGFFFMDNPKKAHLNIDWAKEQLGVQYKKTYMELAELLGWCKDGEILKNNIDLLSFSSTLSKFYNFIQRIIKEDEKYIIYGNGSAGNVIKSFLGNNCVLIVDKSSTLVDTNIENDKVYSPLNIKNIDYDYIIISVIGREENIEIYLTEILKIDKEKIIKINFE